MRLLSVRGDSFLSARTPSLRYVTPDAGKIETNFSLLFTASQSWGFAKFAGIRVKVLIKQVSGRMGVFATRREYQRGRERRGKLHGGMELQLLKRAKERGEVSSGMALRWQTWRIECAWWTKVQVTAYSKLRKYAAPARAPVPHSPLPRNLRAQAKFTRGKTRYVQLPVLL